MWDAGGEELFWYGEMMAPGRWSGIHKRGRKFMMNLFHFSSFYSVLFGDPRRSGLMIRMSHAAFCWTAKGEPSADRNGIFSASIKMNWICCWEFPIGREGSQDRIKRISGSSKAGWFDFLKRRVPQFRYCCWWHFRSIGRKPRVEQIIKLVADNFGQIFITDTNREHLGSYSA